MSSASKSTTVDKSKHGLIVGKGGATIKDLEAKYGVKIIMPKDESTTVTVNGTKAAEAIEAIQALVAPKSASSSASSSSKASSSSSSSKASSSSGKEAAK